MKKMAAAAACFALALALTGCGGGETAQPEAQGDAPAQEQQAQEPEPAPAPNLSLDGVWTFDGADGTKNAISAIIEGDTIKVTFNLEGGPMVYWAGTYDAPASPDDAHQWTSVNDKSITGASFMGSGADTKDFSYKNGVLSFEVTIQGDTAQVDMTKAADELAAQVIADNAPALEVAIGEGMVVSDYEGNPALAVKFTWTNNSDEATSFMVAAMAKAYQDGVQLDTAIYMGDDIDTDTMKDIKPGITQDVWQVFELTSESPVEIEVEEWLGSSGVIASKTIAVK